MHIQVKKKDECKPALPKRLHVLQGLKGYIVSENDDDLVIEMANYDIRVYDTDG